MYVVLLILLAGFSLYLLGSGITRRNRGRIIAGLAVGGGTAAFFSLLGFWGEMLWFRALGYGDRFWTEVIWRVLLSAGFGLAAGLVVFALTLRLPRKPPAARIWPEALAAVTGASWGAANWDKVLLFLNRAETEIADPILGLPTSFYLFTFPLLENIYGFLTWIVVLSAIAAVVYWASVRSSQGGGKETQRLRIVFPEEEHAVDALLVVLGTAAVVLAGGKLLDLVGLLHSEWGAVHGAGWTDVHFRLPAYVVTAAITLLVGLAPLAPPLRRNMSRWLPVPLPGGDRIRAVAAAWGVIVLSWLLGLVILPGLVQWLRVEPNEITFEREYIGNNIEFTRQGFGLERVEEREFPATETFTREIKERNEKLLREVRLWDWRALDAVYRQFQEIRLYYEFHNVDIDRYRIGDRVRQVMVSAREMNVDNLPPESQTFINRRFKYTHGYGLTLAPVSDFTEDGLPNLLVRDIPPQSEHEDLEVTRPEIYYGELENEHVVVNSEEKEFDYPSGDENVYTRYQGDGGVPLSNIWRKFLFGWKFDGTRFFLSGYPTPESRILFHRQIRDRVNSLAPFLRFDADPYIVLAGGELYWILDGYTTSSTYPYSEPYDAREVIEYRMGDAKRELISHTVPYLHGVNYVRNSVKAVVNAYDGSVRFYIFDEKDPLIRAWQGVFPDLFAGTREEMPEALLAHIRYPEGFLLVQGLVFAKYHMTDPTVFYNQEDLWVRATEKYYAQIQPVEPYYVMWEPPESDEAEFVLILPFTPKNRQVLIGWIAGMCDPENYGRFLAYKFPKEKRVLGPQQVETKVDQDPFLSGQLSLWDQRGSSVIRGNVLAIPIEKTLLYVEPIYLQAETAAYPELRLVIVMHGDRLSYAETFEEALHGLFEGKRAAPVGEEGLPYAAAPAERDVEELIRLAGEAFVRYRTLQGEGRFGEAGAELERLEELLRALSEAGGAPPQEEAAGRR